LQPLGHFQFCLAYQGECGPTEPVNHEFHLTPALWEQLDAINRQVNRDVVPAADETIFGRPEVWTYPIDRGDCEDFALLKRRDLAKLGWPLGILLLTVVRQENGDDHAVLTVVTDQGDLILDNLSSEVRPWNQTDYRFLKRQAQENSRLWVGIAPFDGGGGMARSGATP
jgi:predicted transglutaminase-like cysteine proteinase